MSHTYSFRHGNKNQSSSTSSSSSSGGHQRIAYGSRSTSTGTPPQTPTIRVTSPVPDVVKMIDIWDPEVVEDEPPSSTSPKAYSFRYKEEKQHKQRKHQHAPQQPPSSENNKTNLTDSAMQADDPAVAELQTSNTQQHQQQQIIAQPKCLPPIETTIIYINQIGDALSPIEDDGLKTAGESEESSDCEEISQISAVTQIPRCKSKERCCPEVVDEPTSAEENDPLILVDDQILTEETILSEENAQTLIAQLVHTGSQRLWEEMHSSSSDPGKPVKRVQFSRSLSLVPGSSAAHQTACIEVDQRTGGIRCAAAGGRRYSSLDSGGPVNNDIFPSMFTFGEQHQPFAVISSDRKMLSPTPESALENAQSPQQEGADEPGIVPTNIVDEDELLQSSADCCQQPSTDTMTTLSVTVEEVGGDVEGMTNHDPTCDLFDRLNALKNDEELMDLATGFVLQLLRSAQEETLRRGHVASKMEQKSKLSLELQHVAVPKGRHNRKWYSRLRMLLLRTLTCTCVPTHPNIQSPLSN